jgi:hypothetical protein
MGFWSDFLKGLKEGNDEQAGRSGQPVPVPVPRGGQLLPMPRGGQVVARNAKPPAARNARQQPIEQPPSESEFLWEDAIAPAAQLFRFEVWCSATGRPFVAVAERHGETLYIVGNERVNPGEKASSGWPVAIEQCAIEAAPEWRCPWCGVREDPAHDFLRLVWACQNPGCGEPLHCCGSRGGLFRCACGGLSRRTFYRSNVFAVSEYQGLRGPSGRGLPRARELADRVVVNRHEAASTGSLVGRRR